MPGSVLLNRAASSDTSAASTWSVETFVAISIPLTFSGGFPGPWSRRVMLKKVATESVPRTSKSFPTCGFSPMDW